MRRALLLFLAPLLLTAADPPPVARVASADRHLIDDLVLANHILVAQGVIDVRGHVSIRDPRNPNHFLISRAMPPGLVRAADIQTFDLDGRLIEGRADQEAYSERFIHARIYRARPDVQSIVHAHTRSLIVFSDTKLPLRPVMNQAVFVGNRGLAIHDNGPVGAGIHDAAEGDSLARVLGADGAVLMRGHGAVIVGPSLQSAVGRSVSLDVNAQLLISLLSMQTQPNYLVAPADAATKGGDYAREWAWWAAQAARR